jgi:hypothetical protein
MNFEENAMNIKKFKTVVWFVMLIVVLLAACSSGTPEPTQSPTETKSPEPQETEEMEPQVEEEIVETDEADSGAVTSLDDVRKAVIQI